MKTLQNAYDTLKGEILENLQGQEGYEENEMELELWIMSIEEQVENILKSHQLELEGKPTQLPQDKKVFNAFCKDLNTVDWNLLGEGMEEKVLQMRKEMRENIEEDYRQEILNQIINYKGNIQESYDYFMGFTRGDKDKSNSIKGLKIYGKNIGTLKTLSGIKVYGNIEKSSCFQEWINKIFEGQNIKSIEEVIKEKILNYKG
ncbi:MAG: hypothetical protein GY828_04560, partial [Candidatus Gracilibacteria bacterium]|nr:hypothetical protein [Candidatus Gracilibacteria bacterium]